MKIGFINKIKRITAILLLGLLGFSFLHSELGFFDFHGDDSHGSHDFCHIVNNTYTNSNILREEFPKLEINKYICIHYFEGIKTRTQEISFEIQDYHLKTNLNTHLYILHSAFLI